MHVVVLVHFWLSSLLRLSSSQNANMDDSEMAEHDSQISTSNIDSYPGSPALSQSSNFRRNSFPLGHSSEDWSSNPPSPHPRFHGLSNGYSRTPSSVSSLSSSSSGNLVWNMHRIQELEQQHNALKQEHLLLHAGYADLK